jgi:hypothetical protein
MRLRRRPPAGGPEPEVAVREIHRRGLDLKG